MLLLFVMHMVVIIWECMFVVYDGQKRMLQITNVTHTQKNTHTLKKNHNYLLASAQIFYVLAFIVSASLRISTKKTLWPFLLLLFETIHARCFEIYIGSFIWNERNAFRTFCEYTVACLHMQQQNCTHSVICSNERRKRRRKKLILSFACRLLIYACVSCLCYK